MNAVLFDLQKSNLKYEMSITFFKFAYFVIQIIHNVSNCHPLEVVGRDSETQLQVGENLNYIA